HLHALLLCTLYMISYFVFSILSFFFYCYADHRDLHSFPTRRSSDLSTPRKTTSVVVILCFSAYASSCEYNWSDTRILKTFFLVRSEEHTSELQSRFDLVCRLLLEKKKTRKINIR